MGGRGFRTFLSFLSLFLILVVLRPNSAHGQAGTSLAQLNGTVHDATGGYVAKAAVTLRETDTNRSYSTTTADNGFYAFANVAPGRYELRVAFQGFANFTQTGITLTVGQSASIDVTLKVATVGEQVVVNTEAPVIEPTRSEVSQIVDTRQIESLPTSTRLFTDFAMLAPGVASSRTSLGATFTDYETTQISFGGMRSYSNTIMVDGADFTNMLTGVQRSTPPQASAQEFRVVNNSFGAEYGRAGGGIVNIVTRSGNNDFHGSAYEYFQNNATNARYMLQPAPLPYQLRQNQFGGTLGGPVKKDKAFFFLNYEGKRSAQSPVYPPDLVNNLTLIDESKTLMGLAPEGCSTGLRLCTGTAFGYINGFLKTGNNDWGFGRYDQQIGANGHLSIFYNIESIRATGDLVGQTLDGGGIGTPSGGRNRSVLDQALVGTLNSVLRPNLVNTFLAQWSRRHYEFPGATGQPDFSVTNDLEIGHNFGTDDKKYESRVQFSDSVSWIKGKHSWKFGFDGNYIWDLDEFPGFTPVRLIVPGLPCMADFAVFYNSTLPVPATVPQDVANAAANCVLPPSDNGVAVVYAGVPLPKDPNFTVGKPLVTAANNPLNTSTWANAFPPSLAANYTHTINHGYWAGFIQDQWRLTQKLTFNYGLRYEYESGLSGYVVPRYNGWQPRVGLAYSPDSKTVIRAGFGLFDDRYNMTFFFIPNTQKVVAGYMCDNHVPASVAATCAAAGIQPQPYPMVQFNLGQADQGYQLFAFPGSQAAAARAAGVIQTGGYDAFENAPFQPNPGMVSLVGTCSTTGMCGVGAGGMDHNAKIPYSQQASLEVTRQFGAGFTLDVGYLFVSAHHLVRGNNINVPCPLGTTKSAAPTDPSTIFPGGPPEWVPGLVDANGQFSTCAGAPTLGAPGTALAGVGPWFAGAAGSGFQTVSAGLLDYNNNVANAVYNGLIVTARERAGKYLNMLASYTWSHTFDNGNFTTFINLPVNQFNYAAERAPSNQDLRNRFLLNFTATTPDKSFVRYFEFSGIVTLQSGRPFTIFYGNNTLNDLAGPATDRVAAASDTRTCSSVSTCNTMIGRNSYYGDHLYSFDLRVSRYFMIRERYRLDFAVDAFNLFNRPNVDEVTSVYGSPVFCGAIPRNYKDATSRAVQASSSSVACPAGPIPVPGGSVAPTPIGTALFIPSTPSPTFGLPRTMLNPRQFQFSLKLSF